MMPGDTTPPRSRASSASSSDLSTRRKSPSLSLDFSDLPALITPSPPSNTLLVTNLNDPAIFSPTTLAHLRALIDSALATAVAHAATTSANAEDAAVDDDATPPRLSPADTLHAFSPLPSLRRIVLTCTTPAAATHLRATLDGLPLASGARIRAYFGADTPLARLAQADRHLRAPRSQKQFFISPPPSPPAGWTVRDEDPPNTEVHAEDLAAALGRLGGGGGGSSGEGDAGDGEGEMDADATANVDEPLGDAATATAASPTDPTAPSRPQPASPVDQAPSAHTNARPDPAGQRRRADSRTIVFAPAQHGHSPDLPAIAVEDTTANGGLEERDESGTGGWAGGTVRAHTARPPVELMS